ncbi:MAG: FkbM family methyltransferase [Acetobacteraceae bacterium]|nr:FkbM family methyltransferase [Acetobacteraceae bacterium]
MPPLRAVVPAPVRALRWRLPWLRANAGLSPGTLMRMAAFTLRECAGRPFAFETPDGIAFETMPNNFSSFAMCVAGARDPEIWRFIQSRLQPGSTFVDAGANVGAYAVPAARLVGPTGRVIAFEAHPHTHGFLGRNLGRNGLSWATAVNEALGDGPGEIRLAYNTANPGETHVAAAGEADQGATVRMTTLDEALPRLGANAVDYLKVDVEGFELPLLRGAARTIAESPGIAVQIELQPRHAARYGHATADIGRLLLGLGLHPHLLDAAGRPHLLEGALQGDVIWMRR